MQRSRNGLWGMRARVAAVLLAFALVVGAAPVSAEDGRNRRSRSGHIVIKIKPGQEAMAEMTGQAGAYRSAQLDRLGLATVAPPSGQEEATLNELRKDSRIAYAEPDYYAYAQETPNDPMWSQQWGMQRIAAPSAWSISHSRGVVVAVVDTGANLQHPDLQGSLWHNAGEIPGNGADDDGNGKVDDVNGWHFYHRAVGQSYAAAEDASVQDDNGHGSHVAGIVAAQNGNAVGVAGVSWGARLMIVKVLDSQGEGWYSDITQGIIYAADNGARVISLSLGGSELAQSMQDAVNYAWGKGALVVAATGNDGGQVLYPAACDHVMAVAATGAQDQRMSWSNYGAQVDIAAPGDGIVSTWQTGSDYRSLSGTSMATPHVSGAAALLWSWRPDYSNAQVEARIESQADDVNAGSYPGKDGYLGYGRLNIYRMLAGLPSGSGGQPYHVLMPIVQKQSHP